MEAIKSRLARCQTIVQMPVITPFNPNEPSFYLLEYAAHSVPWTRQSFKQCTGARYRTRALWLNGSAVGFSICHLVLDEVTLMNVAVHPDFQGRGLGSMLVQDMIDFVSDEQGRRQRTIFLEVREHNQPAIGLYRRMGFSDIGRRPGYYPAIPPETKAETAVVMRLPKHQDTGNLT